MLSMLSLPSRESLDRYIYMSRDNCLVAQGVRKERARGAQGARKGRARCAQGARKGRASGAQGARKWRARGAQGARKEHALQINARYHTFTTPPRIPKKTYKSF